MRRLKWGAIHSLLVAAWLCWASLYIPGAAGFLPKENPTAPGSCGRIRRDNLQALRLRHARENGVGYFAVVGKLVPVLVLVRRVVFEGPAPRHDTAILGE